MPRTSSAWPCQRACGRKQRQPWALLCIFPLIAEFLRLLLLLQHIARDDKMVSLCCLLLAHARHKPRFVRGVPVTIHSLVVHVYACVSPSPSPSMGSGILAKGTGLPSIPALLWTSEYRRESAWEADVDTTSSLEISPSGPQEETPIG